MDKLFVTLLSGYDSYCCAWVRLAAFPSLCMPVTAQQERLELVHSSHRPCTTRAEPTETTFTSSVSWGASGELEQSWRQGTGMARRTSGQSRSSSRHLQIPLSFIVGGKRRVDKWITQIHLQAEVCKSQNCKVERAFLTLLTSSYYCKSLQRWVSVLLVHFYPSKSPFFF